MTAQTILPANTLSSGYDVANSARFNDGDSAYMNLTSVSTVTNRLKFTISLWVKRSTLGAKSMIGTVGGDNTNFGAIWFDSNDKLNCTEGSGGGELNFITNRVFRDVSAWYHIVLAIDTTQGTESNRVKIYVNGVQQTSFGTSTYPSQNSNMHLNRGGKAQYLGRHTDSSNDYYFDGYMAEVVWIDGSQEAVTSFGEFDEDTNIWKPINVSGLTFGNNGFYLDFEDSANLGNDVNGGTDWTENNFAATDQSTDTCTNNFCTCNPLDQTNTGGSSATMAEGNLKWTSAGNNTSQSYMRATFAVTTGKWYWEVKMGASNSGRGFAFGVAGSEADMNAGSSGNMNDSDPNSKWSNQDSGNAKVMKDGADVTTGLTAVTEGDILQVALDLDNQKIYFGVAGTWQNSADPAAGSNPPATVDANTTYLPAWSDSGYSNAITLELNFGSPSFAISSGNADANGHGNFEYAVPSGYLALCTKNIAESG